ncbi:hypothetical protein PMAYCL1PPCAC_12582, partial [Pristionchus mayeri]
LSCTVMALEWLETVLERKLGVRPTIVKTGPITEGSHGYMAQIRRINLEWPVDRDELPKSVVLKHAFARKNSQCPVAGTAADAWMEASGGGDLDAQEKAKAAAEHAAGMKKVQEMCHAAESQVYGLFDENYPAPCPMPKTYASFGVNHDHPSIVMEDITGATVTDIVDGWTEKQLYTIIDSIVDIHVMSFTTQKWKKLNIEEDEDCMDSFVQMTRDFSINILKHRSLPCLEKIQSHMLQNGDWFKGMYRKYDNHPLSVLVHGDMWAPQFLWRGETLAAIVDWQLSHHGSYMEDFLRLVTLGISAAERARLTPILLQYYYTRLTSSLFVKGVDTPFTFQEMMEEYKASLPYASGMAIFAFSMWSNSPVLKKGDANDEARIEEIYSRMNSLLEEFVKAYGW